jgi:PD-(D/E)XK nuclease superfamily
MTVTTFASPVTPDQALKDRMTKVIRAKSDNNWRSKVVRIGPSEVGDPCLRKLSYKMLEVSKTNSFSDPWPSISGTAIHAWLAEAFEADNGDADWLVEHKVEARPGLAGTLDLFQRSSGTVIDHKCVGGTSLKARKAEGPTLQQIIQLSIYAYGLERQGYEVKQIALAFYPLGGMLTGMHTWVGEYDKDVAIEAMLRLDSTVELLAMLDPEANPERWELVPASESRLCTWCPWFVPSSDNLAIGCPGGSK